MSLAKADLAVRFTAFKHSPPFLRRKVTNINVGAKNMYENNVSLLGKKIEQHAFIRNISQHLLPDGSFDYAGNLKLWDDACEDFEKLPLWDNRENCLRGGCDSAYLIYVPSDNPGADTILVAHGGGFGIRTGCEGANIAWEFHKRGYNTAILVYRILPNNNRYKSMADMQQAIRLLKQKREELCAGEKLILMGFSAGAMLAGNCATLPEYLIAEDGSVTRLGSSMEDEKLVKDNTPDLAVISYGAMSCVSFPLPFMSNADMSLFGESNKDKVFFATEKHISDKTCPMFIWQTLSDDGRHGMTLAKALQDAAVPYELHIFDGGVHGLALADGENDLAADVPHINRWVQLCDEWIQMMCQKNKE